MIISKTRFINYIRCPRYAALDELRIKGLKAIVDIDGVISDECNSKLKEIYANMGLEEEDNPNLEVMLPFYRKVEELSAKRIEEQFGKVTFSMDTYKQKHFKAQINNYSYHCFLDGFTEDEDSFSVFETKATTTKKFLDMSYKENGNSVSLFTESPSGILILNDEIDKSLLLNPKYVNLRSKLKDRFSSCGCYVYDLAFQRMVIERSNEMKKEGKYYLCVLNCEYHYDGKEEMGEASYDSSIIKLIDLTNITFEMIEDLYNDSIICEKNIDNALLEPYSIGAFCERKSYSKCAFLNECWKKIPEHNSIFEFINCSMGFKNGEEKFDVFDLANKGITGILDVDERILNRKMNQIQYDCVKNNNVFMQEGKIRAAIRQIKYPIYHLDFESFPCPLPRFVKEKPYMQSVFQYSLHIEKHQGICDKEIDHYGYLAPDNKDHREDLIKSMIENIKDDHGSIMVFNKTFEETRLKEFGLMFPQYKEIIDDWISRLFDLLDIVKNNKKFYQELGFGEEEASLNNYYHKNLYGSYSIKKVLPVFSELTYKGMPIGNGQEALVTYAKFSTMTKAEFDKNYSDLIKYCCQDTWAMVVILDELRKL